MRHNKDKTLNKGDVEMKKVSFLTVALLLSSAALNAEKSSILEDAQLPANLTDTDVTTLAESFCRDGNEESLTSITLGALQQRDHLVDTILQDVAQNCASSADELAFSINQTLPQQGPAAFATLSTYLQQYNQTDALAALNSTNSTLLAQLQNQGLELETAAGPSALNFDSVLESINIPTENPAQLSAN